MRRNPQPEVRAPYALSRKANAKAAKNADVAREAWRVAREIGDAGAIAKAQAEYIARYCMVWRCR